MRSTTSSWSIRSPRSADSIPSSTPAIKLAWRCSMVLTVSCTTCAASLPLRAANALSRASVSGVKCTSMPVSLGIAPRVVNGVDTGYTGLTWPVTALTESLRQPAPPAPWLSQQTETARCLTSSLPESLPCGRPLSKSLAHGFTASFELPAPESRDEPASPPSVYCGVFSFLARVAHRPPRAGLTTTAAQDEGLVQSRGGHRASTGPNPEQEVNPIQCAQRQS